MWVVQEGRRGRGGRDDTDTNTHPDSPGSCYTILQWYPRPGMMPCATVAAGRAFH